MNTDINARAKWYVSDGNEAKSTTFRLLNMIHVMAGRAAVSSKDSEWHLARTRTEENYVLTVWTNGIVDVGAESHKDYNRDYLSHEYWMKACGEEDDE